MSDESMDVSQLKVAELRSFLTRHDVSIPASARRKADLVKLACGWQATGTSARPSIQGPVPGG